MDKAKFSKNQMRIFVICFMSYVCAYIARLNLSAALNSVIGDMALTDAQGGMFQTVFALVYAVGQLVNGSVVDRISAKVYIFLGLLLSGLANLCFGMANAYWMMVAFWSLNGAAQSMLWTPIVKLMAVWFKGKRRSRVSFGLSMTLVLGNLSAWALSGYLASVLSWRMSFMIPAAVVAVMGTVALLTLRDQPEPGEDLGEEEAAPVKEKKEVFGGSMMPIKTMLQTTGLVMIMLCCICNGFVRDGIITWAPTIIANLGSGQAINPTLVSLIIPILNLGGVLMAYRCYHMFGDNARRCVGCLMAVSAILAVALHLASVVIVVCTLVLGLCCAATYGINPMLTTLIPMEYEKAGRVGLVAGMMDCFIYLGSSLSGVLIGAVSDAAGWPVVFVLWCCVAAAGVVFAFMSMRGEKRLAQWGN